MGKKAEKREKEGEEGLHNRGKAQVLAIADSHLQNALHELRMESVPVTSN